MQTKEVDAIVIKHARKEDTQKNKNGQAQKKKKIDMLKHSFDLTST